MAPIILPLLLGQCWYLSIIIHKYLIDTNVSGNIVKPGDMALTYFLWGTVWGSAFEI